MSVLVCQFDKKSSRMYSETTQKEERVRCYTNCDITGLVVLANSNILEALFVAFELKSVFVSRIKCRFVILTADQVDLLDRSVLLQDQEECRFVPLVVHMFVQVAQC